MWSFPSHAGLYPFFFFLSILFLLTFLSAQDLVLKQKWLFSIRVYVRTRFFCYHFVHIILFMAAYGHVSSGRTSTVIILLIYFALGTYFYVNLIPDLTIFIVIFFVYFILLVTVSRQAVLNGILVIILVCRGYLQTKLFCTEV